MTPDGSLGAVGYRLGQLGPARYTDKSVTALAAPAEWISPLTRDLEEVMNSESLELQAIFNSDHMARSSNLPAISQLCCRALRTAFHGCFAN